MLHARARIAKNNINDINLIFNVYIGLYAFRRVDDLMKASCNCKVVNCKCKYVRGLGNGRRRYTDRLLIREKSRPDLSSRSQTGGSTRNLQDASRAR